MSTSDTIFLIVGGVGIVFLLASALFGGIEGFDHDVGHLSHDTDAGHADTSTVGGDVGLTPSWKSTNILAAAIFGFGGTGLLASYYGAPVLLAWLLAIIGGLGLGAITLQLVVKPLARMQHNSLISRQSYVGMRGRVTVSIPSDGFGEVFIRDVNGANVLQRATSASDTLPYNALIFVVDVTPEGVIVDYDPTVPLS